MSTALVQIAQRQAVKTAANLRQAAAFLRLDSTINLIEGDDKGRAYVEKLTKAILATLNEPEQTKTTLSLKRDVA